ncbi:hypothetical protein, partial [Lacticaseibacillus nasuensis]|uniref:hypothetical protein n=1 Tax=Lacticaseibacillus nasuensis TaxID=944671 RepID=UPI001CDACD9E
MPGDTKNALATRCESAGHLACLYLIVVDASAGIVDKILGPGLDYACVLYYWETLATLIVSLIIKPMASLQPVIVRWDKWF